MYLMLASCSADEPVAQNTTDGVIRYTVATANQSRAKNSYCANNKPDEFTVWATNSDDNKTYIDGDVIKRGPGDVYTDDSGIRYWPESGDLSFYAVVDDNSKFNFDDKKVVGYEVSTTVSEQLDLMYAVETVENNPTNQGKEVQLNFRHALSQICFKARNENPKSVITINKIILNGIYNTGTYDLSAVGTTKGQIIDHDDDLTVPAIVKRGSWTLVEDNAHTKSYTIDFSGDGGIELSDSYTFLGVDLSSTHSDEWYTNVLNLIPQTKHTTFNLHVKVENENGDLVADNLSVEVPVDISWKEGNRYIYAFNFPKDWQTAGLNAIEYDVTIDDFNETYTVIGGHDAALMRESPALYFATTNIGASSPEKTGLYFWWGDIVGHTVGDGFDFYTAPTKGMSLTELKNEGYMTEANDETGHLTPEKDAATQLWGSDWRMPTKAELEWLADGSNCVWHWETSPVKGYTVVSRTTGGSIFLPAAGYIEKLTHTGTGTSYYWSSQPEDDVYYDSKHQIDNRAWRLRALSEGGEHAVHNIGNRTDGFPIRPVSNGATITPTPSK